MKDGQHATKKAIIATAIGLFGERGFHATSVRDIVSATGITQGAFYHHFESKEEVLLDIHRAFIETYSDLILGILETQQDPVSTLRSLIVELLVFVERFQMEVAIFFEERQFLDERAFSEVKRRLEQTNQGMLRLVSEGMRSGRLRRVGNPTIVLNAFLGMCTWAYQWYRPSGLTSREIGNVFADIILTGLDAGARGG
ncbi:MAG: TetR/AcrR family transcriptional regulator [Actinomycetes bacterium]